MTKEECIALLNRYAEYNGMGIPNLAGCREAMRTAAELLQRPSLPSNLDDAAEDSSLKYSIKLEECGITASDSVHYRTGFKAGAEWMAGQGETLESLIWRDEDDKLFIEAFVDENKFKMADNVTIQIRKKQ